MGKNQTKPKTAESNPGESGESIYRIACVRHGSLIVQPQQVCSHSYSFGKKEREGKRFIIAH